MHSADIIAAAFIGGLLLLLVGRLVSEFIRAKLA